MTAPTRMDWKKLLDESRCTKEDAPSNDPRTPFRRDVDRITFCDPFRRLARKTQVHPLNENDHVHSRLTHSLEAASVGRSLGEAVGKHIKEMGELPEGVSPTDMGEIVQAACLAHDIGNPPFGHSGEAAIKDWFQGWFEEDDVNKEDFGGARETDFTAFDGNAMAVRVLLRTGYYTEGMNPTRAVLGALLKYPWPSSFDPAKAKFSFFQTEADLVAETADALGLIPMEAGRHSRPPLAFLTEAADDICYRLIDIEDATEVGIVDRRFMFDRFKGIPGLLSKERLDQFETSHFRQRNSYLRTRLMGAAIVQIAGLFKTHYEAIKHGEFDRRSSLMEAADDGVCRVIFDTYESLKDDLFHSRRKAVLEMGAHTAIGAILDRTMAELDALCGEESSTNRNKVRALIGPKLVDMATTSNNCRYPMTMTILDYVSGMTDHYARETHRKLLGLGE